MRRLLSLSLLVLCVVSCSSDDDFTPTTPSGPSIPTIGGTYNSPTMWRFETTNAAGQTTAFECSGGLTVATQVGTSFSGTFFVSDPGCGNLTGNVANGVLTSTAVTFDLTVPQPDPNFLTWAFGCIYVSGDTGATGTLVDNRLDAQQRTVMDCTPEGRVTVLMRLSGVKP